MAGTINVTTGDGPGVQVLTIEVPGAQGPTGLTGAPGPSTVLTIGSVTTGDPGSTAGATLSGVSPNQVLNLTIPQGPVGPVGPPNALTIGTVTTVDGVTGGSATITGISPNQVLNLTLPRGYGVNTGGAVGDVLVKSSTDDYDVTWLGSTASNTAGTIVRRSTGNSFAITGITGLSTPTQSDAAANKAYVDSQVTAFRRVATNAVATNTYTFALTDEGKVVYYSADNSAVTYTIPTNATVALPVGAWIDVYSGATGVVTIQGASGVSLRGPDGTATVVLRNIYSKVRLTKSNTDTWQWSGDAVTSTSTAVTGATAVGTPAALVKRDVAGRAQVVDPAAAQDIATKNYVDVTAGSAPSTASSLVRRDVNGVSAFGQVQITVSVPSAVNHATRKDYVDAGDAATLASAKSYADTATAGVTVADATTTAKGMVQLAGDLGGTAAAPTVTGGTHHTHTSAQISDASAPSVASTVVSRDASGVSAFNQVQLTVSAPTAANHATRKDYVDAAVALSEKTANKDAVNGYVGLDATANASVNGTVTAKSGFIIPAFAPTAAPASGNLIYSDNTGVGTMVYLRDSAGHQRRISAHWGTYQGSAAWPSYTATGAREGDTLLWDAGISGARTSLWVYTTTVAAASASYRWVLKEEPVFATVAIRNTWLTQLQAVSATLPYNGMRVYITGQQQSHVYDATNSTWRGTAQAIISTSNVWSNTRVAWNDTAWHQMLGISMADPGFPYYLRSTMRVEWTGTPINSRGQFRVHADTSNVDILVGYQTQYTSNIWNFFTASGTSGVLTGLQGLIHYDFACYTANQAAQYTDYNGLLETVIVPAVATF